MASRILSDEQLAQMAELRERGWSSARIATWFTSRGTKVTEATIAWQCLLSGVLSPRQLSYRFPDIASSEPIVRQRGGRPVRSFTAAEDAQLLELEQAGLGPSIIGKRLTPPRASNSVKARLMILARRDALAEARAEQKQAA